jgi:hypothetical protein
MTSNLGGAQPASSGLDSHGPVSNMSLIECFVCFFGWLVGWLVRRLVVAFLCARKIKLSLSLSLSGSPRATRLLASCLSLQAPAPKWRSEGEEGSDDSILSTTIIHFM